ncbi:MAG: CBS domain-containing protein [Motiliproteus sp.]
MRDIDYSTAPFQLSDLQAWQVMEESVDTCKASISCRDASELLIVRGRGCMPVVDDLNSVIGFISEYDLLQIVKSHGDLESEQVGDHMITDVVSVSRESSIADVLGVLEDKHYLRVPVISDGKLQGLISRRDVLYATLKGKAKYYKIP